MGTKRESDRKEKQPFEFRPVAAQMPHFGGMYRRGDPASIPPHKFRLLVNARVGEGEVKNRPGLAYVAGAEGGEDACITGIFDLGDAFGGGGMPGVTGICYALDRDPDADPPDTTRILGRFDSAADPTFTFWDQGVVMQPVISGNPLEGGDGTPYQALVRWNGKTLVACYDGTETSLYELSLDPELANELSMAKVLVVDSSGSFPYVMSMCVRSERQDDSGGNPEIVSALYWGDAAGRIFRYDGTTMEQVYTDVTGSRIRVAAYQGKGVVGVGDTYAAGFFFQEDPSKSWDTKAWPTLTNFPSQDFVCNGIVEYLGAVIFYGVCSNRPCALKWSGLGTDDPAPLWDYDTVGTDDEGIMPLRATVFAGVLYIVTYPHESGLNTKEWRARYFQSLSPLTNPSTGATILKYQDTPAKLGFVRAHSGIVIVAGTPENSLAEVDLQVKGYTTVEMQTPGDAVGVVLARTEHTVGQERAPHEVVFL